MADAGTIWYEALSGAGQNIGQGINQVVQQRQKLQQTDALMNMGSRFTWGDILGDPSNKTPLVTPKLQKEWDAARKVHNARQEGAIMQLLNMGAGLQQERYKAQLKQQGRMLPTPTTGPITSGDFYWEPTKGWVQRKPTPVDPSKKPLTPAQQLQQKAREKSEQQKEAAAEAKAQTAAQSHADKERTGILKQIQAMGFSDVEGLLQSGGTKGTIKTEGLRTGIMEQPSAVRQQMPEFLGGKTAPTFKPTDKDATHVELPDGTQVKLSRYRNAVNLARKYKSLEKVKVVPTSHIPAPAIEVLKKDPSEKNKAYFDRWFGKGAADQILGQTDTTGNDDSGNDDSGDDDEDEK